MRKEESLIENTTQTDPVTGLLQVLLADLQVHYMNLRGYHWNINGKNFFTLHAKFEEMYLDTAEKADEIAERLLALDCTPCNRISQYLKTSKIEEVHGVNCNETAMANLLETYTSLVNSERLLMKEAASTGDEVTADLMISYMKEQDKTIWMLSAYLE